VAALLVSLGKLFYRWTFVLVGILFVAGAVFNLTSAYGFLRLASPGPIGLVTGYGLAGLVIGAFSLAFMWGGAAMVRVNWAVLAAARAEALAPADDEPSIYPR
jgi:hypothetical protein